MAPAGAEGAGVAGEVANAAAEQAREEAPSRPVGRGAGGCWLPAAGSSLCHAFLRD